MKTVLEFAKAKSDRRPISVVTAYDAWTARLVNASPIDAILVGDSAAMVMHGHPSTTQATLEMMITHTEAVVRAAPDKFIIGDLPFLTYRKSVPEAVEAAGRLIRAGAHSVKLEGVDGHEDAVARIVQSGIPVMGHLGLTPQSVHSMGGFRVQAREQAEAKHLLEQASKLQALGCFSIVLECIPAELARRVSEHLAIPTIGIGAGSETDGQVLVLQDLLGANPQFAPKFLRKFAQIHETIASALNQYHHATIERTYPNKAESYADTYSDTQGKKS